jgi:hypothetical protein
MAMKFMHLAGVTLSLLSAAAVVSPKAQAQYTEVETPQTILEAADELTSQSSGNFFQNRSLGRQAANIFGFGFRDRELLRDGAVVEQEFKALMQLQNEADPTIRVPDLSNPYTASLLTLPSSAAPTLGTEFIFEPF